MISFLSPAHVAEPLHPHSKLVIVKGLWNKSALVRGRVLQGITGFNRPRTNPVRINSCRRLAGSSFRSCVQDCSQTSHGIFHRFSLSPVLSSLAAAHVPEHAARSVGNVRKVVGEIQNVEC